MHSLSKSKHRKAQFFIISAFTIVTILYFISKWMEPYTIPDTSAVVLNDEPFILNNLVEKAREIIWQSKDATEANYSLQEFANFIKDYGIIKNLDIEFSASNITMQEEEEGEPVDVALLIDKSGSMGNEEKLPKAKEAAKDFIDYMDFSTDRVAVLSFSSGTRGDPVPVTIDQPLTNNGEAAKTAIDSLVVDRNTNLGEGIRVAKEELLGLRGSAPCADCTRVIIALTDGCANEINPDGSGACSEGCPISHTVCTQFALDEATDAKADGIVVFIIGLDLDALCTTPEQMEWMRTFMKDMASKDEYYYEAPSPDDLEEIYKEIAGEILHGDFAYAYCISITSPQFKIGTCKEEIVMAESPS